MEQNIKFHNTRETSISSPSLSNSPLPTKAHDAHHHHGHEHEGIELHTLIGVSLSFGFIFMLLVDQISGGHSHGPSGKINSIADEVLQDHHYGHLIS